MSTITKRKLTTAQLSKMPASQDHLGWSKLYQRRFDEHVKNNDDYSATYAVQLALWYLFLHLDKGENL